MNPGQEVSAEKRISSNPGDLRLTHTHLIEPLSLDEAYLDMTENLHGIPYATHLDRRSAPS